MSAHFILKKSTAMAVVIVSAFTLSGCLATTGSRGPLAGNSCGNNMATIGGGVLGAAGGAVAGAQFGGGKGNLAMTAIGTLLGAGLGAMAGSSMDRGDCAYELQMQQAQQRSLETARTGQQVPWTDPSSGISGYTTPTRTLHQGGQTCREFENAIRIGGRIEKAVGVACRQPDGSWRVESSQPVGY